MSDYTDYFNLDALEPAHSDKGGSQVDIFYVSLEFLECHPFFYFMSKISDIL